jgi:hypothetical protein
LAAAGAAYVFTLDGGRWVPQTRLQARAAEPHGAFGYSVALAKDKIAIGAPHFDDLSQDTPRGQVVLFERMGGQWRETVTLQAPNPRTHDLFGQSVGLVDRLLAVGAAGDNSGARGIGGDPLRTDSSNSGALHLFELGSGNEWQPTSFIKASNADRNDNFGCSIAMSESGLIISANGEASSGPGNAADNSALASGAVYAFQ